MKRNKYIILFLGIALSVGIHAQDFLKLPNAMTPMGRLHIYTPKPKLPDLLLLDYSIVFDDNSRNRTIEVGEKCNLRFQVVNKGRGSGVNCVARLTAEGAYEGLSFGDRPLPMIASGDTATIEMPIYASQKLLDGSVKFSFRVEEPQGFSTKEHYLIIPTKGQTISQ